MMRAHHYVSIEDRTMTREQALPYVSYYLDDAPSPDHSTTDIKDDARLVGWQCRTRSARSRSHQHKFKGVYHGRYLHTSLYRVRSLVLV
jgi:hypothetical protein